MAEATDYINNLPAGTQIRNLVGLGHGFGSSDAGSGRFAIQSFIAARGTLAPLPNDLLGAPGAGASAETSAFWDAVARRLVLDGQVRIQFLACYIGRDPDFVARVQEEVEIAARANGSSASVAVDAFRDYYAVATRTNADGSIETFSKEVPSEPANEQEAIRLRRTVVQQGVPASVGHARPSVSHP